MGFEIETGPKKRVKLENQENQWCALIYVFIQNIKI